MKQVAPLEPAPTPALAEADAASPEPSSISATPPVDEAEAAAWRRVDAMFSHVVRGANRSPVLEGLSDDAIEQLSPGVRRLSFQSGLLEFRPDARCERKPLRKGCRHEPVWGPGGGVYLDVRVHHQAHAAGFFDAVHALGPLTVEVRIFASDPALKSLLLREIRIFAGAAAEARPGCVDPVEQARAEIGGTADALDFEPAWTDVDLDDDGVLDLVLAYRNYGENVDHFFYRIRRGCPRLVGRINFWIVSGIGCRRDEGQKMCDLHVHQLMVHGDEQESVWRFDGKRYVEKDR
ncbi:MAG: hypothetical protein AAF799_12630 [Myxococcota bacterium]